MRSGRELDWRLAFLILGLPFCAALPPLLIVWLWVLMRWLRDEFGHYDPVSGMRARTRSRLIDRHPDLFSEHCDATRRLEVDWTASEWSRGVDERLAQSKLAEHAKKDCPFCRDEQQMRETLQRRR